MSKRISDFLRGLHMFANLGFSRTRNTPCTPLFVHRTRRTVTEKGSKPWRQTHTFGAVVCLLQAASHRDFCHSILYHGILRLLPGHFDKKDIVTGKASRKRFITASKAACSFTSILKPLCTTYQLVRLFHLTGVS